MVIVLVFNLVCLNFMQSFFFFFTSIKFQKMVKISKNKVLKMLVDFNIVLGRGGGEVQSGASWPDHAKLELNSVHCNICPKQLSPAL